MNNGFVNESGSYVEKDTAVYAKDVNNAQNKIEKLNNLKRQKAYDNFKKDK